MTPRDALAAALGAHQLITDPAECSCGDWSYRDEPGLYFDAHQDDAILSALAAEGWVLVRKVQPRDGDCACHRHDHEETYPLGGYPV